MSIFVALHAGRKQIFQHPTADIFKPLQWLHRAWRVPGGLVTQSMGISGLPLPPHTGGRGFGTVR